MKIYLDLDGVVCDFESGFKNLAGISALEYKEKYGDTKFWEKVSTGGIEFWANLEWMPDGKELWRYVRKNVETIITSPAKDISSRLGKCLWVKKNLKTNRDLIFSWHKYRYASDERILIDDREKNTFGWKANGGNIITHVSAKETIRILKNEYGL